MTIDREKAYTAFYTHLKKNKNISEVIRTMTRKLKHWTDVPPEDAPAIYLEIDGESRTIVRGQLPRITLESNLWVYVKSEGGEVGPILNPILDLIDVALAPNPVSEVQTLGGLVHHCWIEGSTQVFEGNLGEDAVAIIPIRMLLT